MACIDHQSHQACADVVAVATVSVCGAPVTAVSVRLLLLLLLPVLLAECAGCGFQRQQLCSSVRP
jgi:hypothetical protein